MSRDILVQEPIVGLSRGWSEGRRDVPELTRTLLIPLKGGVSKQEREKRRRYEDGTYTDSRGNVG